MVLMNRRMPTGASILGSRIGSMNRARSMLSDKEYEWIVVVDISAKGIT